MRALHNLDIPTGFALRDGDFMRTLSTLPAAPVINRINDYPPRKVGNKTCDLVLRVMESGVWYTVQELSDKAGRTVSMVRKALKDDLQDQGLVMHRKSTRRGVLEYVWRLK